MLFKKKNKKTNRITKKKEGQYQGCSNYHTTALISHASKEILKILQARLQCYVNWKPPYVQAGFRKGRGTRDQIANIRWIITKAKEFQENIYIDYTKAFDFVDHNKLWKILNEMGIPDHLTCLLRNLQAGQEVIEPDMEQQTGSKLGKEFIKAVCCHPVYLTIFKSIYNMQNAGLDDSQAGIKTARRNINNLRYTDDTTLMAESEKALKSVLMKVKEEEWKSWFKTQHSKN